MEEILVLIVQFIIEVLLEFVVYLPFDLPLDRNRKTGARTGPGRIGIYILIGGVLGGLSVLIAPKFFIHSSAMRVVNLLVAPLVSGGLSYGLATWRRSRGAQTAPWTHLWTAFWFVLAFAAVRLVFAHV